MKAWFGAAIFSVSCLWSIYSSAEELLEVRWGLSALHLIQDEIARGTADSSQFQTVILDRVTDRLEQLPDTAFANPDFQLALIELALSGGERARILKLIGKTPRKGPLLPQLSGVEAYLNGEMGKAAKAFEVTMPQGFGDSHVDHFMELAKGTAWLDSDLQRASQAFQMAMLYAPGTLVEEVALRRLTGISLRKRNPELFLRCANIYLRRYRDSPFAREFMSSFVSGALLVTNREDMAQLGNLVVLLPAQRSRPLLSALTAKLLTKGKIEPAEVFAAYLRETIDHTNAITEQKAESLVLDILINTADASTGGSLLLLKNLEGKLAAPGMMELLDVARHVAWNIYKPAELSAEVLPGGTTKNADSSDDFANADQILTRAKIALKRLNASKGPTQ